MDDDIQFCVYYMMGDRPVRIAYIAPDVAVMAEIPDHTTKTFTIDNSFIHIAATSMDAQEIGEDEFNSWCKENGYTAT